MTHYPFNRRRHIKERDKLQVSLLAFFLLLGGLVCSYEIYSQNFVRGTQFSSYNRILTYSLGATTTGLSLTAGLWGGGGDTLMGENFSETNELDQINQLNDYFTVRLVLGDSLDLISSKQFNRTADRGNFSLEDSSHILGALFFNVNSPVVLGVDTIRVDTLMDANCGYIRNSYICKIDKFDSIIDITTFGGPRAEITAIGHSNYDNSIITVTNYCQDTGRQGDELFYANDFHSHSEGLTMITKWDENLDII